MAGQLLRCSLYDINHPSFTSMDAQTTSSTISAGCRCLFWRLIEESKESGVEEIDFGRSDFDHEGLITFKDRFGTTRTSLTYYRYANAEKGKTAMTWNSQAVRQVFSVLPDAVCCAAGRFLYRHLG